jgi:AraC-like DNA-binding protein
MHKIIGLNDKVIPFQHHPLALINYVINQRSGDIDNLLAGTNILVKQFSNIDLFISYKQYSQLVVNCLAETKDEFLGLAFGKSLSVHTHGLIGLTVLSQPTVRDGIKVAIKYKKIVSPITTLSFDEYEHHTEVSVIEALGFKELEQFFTETLYGSSMTGFRTLTSDDSCHINFYFKYSSNEKLLTQYKKYLGDNLLFSQSRNYMSATNEYFDKKVTISNSTIALALEEQVRNIFKKVANHEGIIGLVRSLLVKADQQFPSLDTTAEKMNTSASTIKRKLREYNTSYQRVLNEVRMEIAIGYLQNSTKTIKDICYELGYQEPSTFSRAFRKWTTMSPQEYRDKYKSKLK